MYRIALLFIALFFVFTSFAQRGKMANPNISATVVVNEYTSLSNSANAGATTISVANSGLNINTRFSGNLAQGDLLMIIQMQGVLTNATPFINRSEPNDTTWGTILNYNNCGRYEFVEVLSVPNNSTINLSCPLSNSYTDTGKVQVIRVPRYASLTINGAGTIQAQPWNGTTGGVVAVEVSGNTTIDGQINVNGQGFRGGALDPNSLIGGGFYAAPADNEGAEKGEGVGGSAIDYAKYLGRYCMGAPANGGGGGTAHNAGGGGGGNAGILNNWKSGRGNPDISNPGWVTAWNLEFGGFGSVTWSASGGGRGGYSWSSSNRDATVEGPGNTNWTGDNRRNIGGKGGRPLNYSTGRIFMGAGGGAGDQNDGDGTAGANGGGLVFLQTYGTVSGSGSINANGITAADTDDSGSSFTLRGQDGAGGGGAGGTILIRSTGAISSITCNANGGNGGSVRMRYWQGTITDAYGPGGGGGGGYIAISNGAITRNTNGGVNGIVSSSTSSIPVSEFPPNGATRGGVGINNATITAYDLIAIHDTVCFGQTANLGVSVVGTLPGSSTVNWYTLPVGGTSINTGLTYNPTNVTAPDTFYVGVCPGTFRIPVYLSIAPAPIANAGQDTSICFGDTVQLNASGGTSYVWDANPNLSATNIPNPLAFPNTTMYFYVTVTNSNGCSSRDSVLVSISSALVIDAGNDTTICNGSSVQLNATGGVNYTWDADPALSATNIPNPIASPTSTQYFYVTANNGAGCNGRDSVLVTISPQIISGISNDTTICLGNSATISANASGGTPTYTYSWNQSLGTGSVKTVSPTSNTSYIVTITDASNCSIMDTVSVSIFPAANVSAGNDTSICLGDTVQLGASGGTSYVWDANPNLSATNISNPLAFPNTTMYFYVTISDVNGCSYRDSVQVTVAPSLNVDAGNDTTICNGTSVQLNATGGVNYTWDANPALSATNVSNPIASPTSSQYFYVTANNGAGCTGRDSVLVTISPQIVSGISNDTTICQGTSVTILANASGGTPTITYSWNQGLGSGASKNVSPTSTTTYVVTITDGANCSIQDSVTLSLFPALSSSITASDTTICFGDSVILTAIPLGGNGGSYSFTWNDGATNIGTTNPIVVYPSGNTTYTVTVTDNCTTPASTSQVTITIASKPNVSISVSPDNGCAPLSTTFTVVGNNNYTYSWDYDGNNTTDFSGTSTSSSYTYVNPGSYFPIITVSSGGCDTVITFTTPIQVNLTPSANFSALPNPSAPGESISFTDLSNFASSWFWTFGDGDTAIVADTNHIYATSGSYTVCLTIDYQGCNDSICKEIVVIGEIVVPNVFSPNGDGSNDIFVIEGLWGMGNSLEIYNRWGQIIYKNDNYNNTWDGYTSAGVEVPEGTYFAVFTTKDGEIYKQTVTLIK